MNTRGQMIAGMHEKPTGLVKCSQSTDHAGKTTYQVWTESSWTPTGLCWETHYVKGGADISSTKTQGQASWETAGTNTLPQSPTRFHWKKKRPKT